MSSQSRTRTNHRRRRFCVWRTTSCWYYLFFMLLWNPAISFRSVSIVTRHCQRKQLTRNIVGDAATASLLRDKPMVVPWFRRSRNYHSYSNSNRRLTTRTTTTTTSSSTTTSLNSFMGSDGGILGIGTPELFTILLVGYFVLGPSDLYKIVKEIGKFIQNARTLSGDLSKTLESNMESQLQLEELRKAQAELTDAFSFRRSINVDETGDAFSTNAATPREGTAAVAVASTGSSATKKKRIRRRKIRASEGREEGTAAAAADLPSFTNGEVLPDLEMPAPGDLEEIPEPATVAAAAAAAATTDDANTETKNDAAAREASATATVTKMESPTAVDKNEDDDDEEAKKIDEEFAKYTQSSDWYSGDTTTERERSDNDDQEQQQQHEPSWYDDKAEQSRFQQQMSGNWNDKILANEDKLEPMGKVMEMLALLEEERGAAARRLEEEYQRRRDLDEEYYQKQRRVLEDAAAAVQKDIYNQL